MKRTNGGSLLGRVGRKSEMRRTSTGGARSVDIWPASALEFSFGTLLVILLAALKMPRAVTPSLLAQGTSGTVSNRCVEMMFVKWYKYSYYWRFVLFEDWSFNNRNIKYFLYGCIQNRAIFNAEASISFPKIVRRIISRTAMYPKIPMCNNISSIRVHIIYD